MQISLIRGDITRIEADTIVNVANSTLMGGVDGAIHRADGDSGEAEKLSNGYLNSLNLAQEYNLKTIAFPNISTGVFGYPPEQAAEVTIDAVVNAEVKRVEPVVLVCFGEEDYKLYREKLESKIQQNHNVAN